MHFPIEGLSPHRAHTQRLLNNLLYLCVTSHIVNTSALNLIQRRPLHTTPLNLRGRSIRPERDNEGDGPKGSDESNLTQSHPRLHAVI